MPRVLTDAEIERLLNEPKKLPRNWRDRLKPILYPSDPNARRDWPFQGESGSQFAVHVRENKLNLNDFSIILCYIGEDQCEYRLTRFNGKHPSDHTNKYEKKHGLPNKKFRNTFHIHLATERYQLEGFAIDGFAHFTDRYSSFDSALAEFAGCNGFAIDEESGQPKLPGFEQ